MKDTSWPWAVKARCGALYYGATARPASSTTGGYCNDFIKNVLFELWGDYTPSSFSCQWQRQNIDGGRDDDREFHLNYSEFVLGDSLSKTMFTVYIQKSGSRADHVRYPNLESSQLLPVSLIACKRSGGRPLFTCLGLGLLYECRPPGASFEDSSEESGGAMHVVMWKGWEMIAWKKRDGGSSRVLDPRFTSYSFLNTKAAEDLKRDAYLDLALLRTHMNVAKTWYSRQRHVNHFVRQVVSLLTWWHL